MSYSRIQERWLGKIVLVFALTAVISAAAAGQTITGVARDRTRGRMATGEEVILLSVDQDTREESRTRTDSRGAFTFEVKSSAKPYLLRIVHKGVNYDVPASTGHFVSIDLFDAAEKVNGVTGSIEIIRVGTKGNVLHVSDMIEIKNESYPPLTQAGARTFEVYLPSNARIDSVLAAGPNAGQEKIGVMISAAPVPGEPGHYSVNFPLRPGATKFAFNYDMPYDGYASFHPKHEYALQQLAIMLPPAMKFSSASHAFQALPTGSTTYRIEAIPRLEAGNGPEFEISGTGPLPALQTQSPPKVPAATLPTPSPTAPRYSQARQQVANPSGALTASSSSPQRWLALGTCLVSILAACVHFLWHRRRLSTEAITPPQWINKPTPLSVSLVGALKTELLQLEIDRSHGSISGEDYDSAKIALETTVRRTLARAGTGGGASRSRACTRES